MLRPVVIAVSLCLLAVGGAAAMMLASPGPIAGPAPVERSVAPAASEGDLCIPSGQTCVVNGTKCCDSTEECLGKFPNTRCKKRGS